MTQIRFYSDNDLNLGKLEFINETKLRIYVEVANNRDYKEKNIAIESWEPIKFEGRDLFVKVNFSKPLSISPLQEQDRLKIQFLDEEFIFKDSKIDDKSFSIDKNIPKLMIDNDFNRGVTDAANNQAGGF